MEEQYRGAVYAELEANQDRIDTENGLDFSLEGWADKCASKSLEALIQQSLLLCANDNLSPDTEWTLEDALMKVLSLENRSGIVQDGAESFDAIEGLVNTIMHPNNNRYIQTPTHV
jgi:hypothetical protein